MHLLGNAYSWPTTSDPEPGKCEPIKPDTSPFNKAPGTRCWSNGMVPVWIGLLSPTRVTNWSTISALITLLAVYTSPSISCKWQYCRAHCRNLIVAMDLEIAPLEAAAGSLTWTVAPAPLPPWTAPLPDRLDFYWQLYLLRLRLLVGTTAWKGLVPRSWDYLTPASFGSIPSGLAPPAVDGESQGRGNNCRCLWCRVRLVYRFPRPASPERLKWPCVWSGNRSSRDRTRNSRGFPWLVLWPLKGWNMWKRMILINPGLILTCWTRREIFLCQ